MRTLAVATLLALSAARSEAQVRSEKTTRLGTLEFTSSVAHGERSDPLSAPDVAPSGR